MTKTSDFTASTERFSNWLFGAAAPLWLERGWDEIHGGFVEALDFNGAPITELPRRVRVQCRQIYFFDRLSRETGNAAASRRAQEGFEHLKAHAFPDGAEAGCAHILDPTGRILDRRRDLYDQAFVMLACAERWRATGDESALLLARQIRSFLDQTLASPHGGWREDDSGRLPRRQNPHMHLFEAFMALFDATGDAAYRADADRLFALFQDRFFDHDNRVLREFFADDLSIAPGAVGAIIEPGHMVEWVWLLDAYGSISGADVAALQSA
ncbi:MAG: AGE family epimerase/isomerase, partial [Pseudomonadota bacterium]